MTTDSSFPYTAGFKLFRPDGLQVYFTVNGSEPSKHAAAVDGYIAAMMTSGYAVNPPSLEDGERVESIGGWVLGETSHDQPCVYLYGSHPGLQFRIVTVYEERIPDLPFKVDTNGKRWPGAAPTRDMATTKGYLHEVPEFEIVLTPHEFKKKDDGSPVMVFGRVKAKPAAPVSQPPEREPQTNDSGNGSARPAGALEDDEQAIFDAHPREFYNLVARYIPRYRNEPGKAMGAAEKITGKRSLPVKPMERVELFRSLKEHAKWRDAEDAHADLLAAVGQNADSAHNKPLREGAYA